MDTRGNQDSGMEEKNMIAGFDPSTHDQPWHTKHTQP
jgi:hypothetical protein